MPLSWESPITSRTKNSDTENQEPGPWNLSPVLVSAAILQDKQGRVLLAQRPANKPMPHLWEFPGGKIMQGETPEEALCREINEELGIILDISNLQPLTFVTHRYPNFFLILLAYLCRRWQGAPQPKENQGGIVWIYPCDLPNYEQPEANKLLVPMLQNLSTDFN